MKLKILKSFMLANPEVSKPHWSFKADEVIDTDNEYLINRLIELNAAKIIDKTNEVKQENIFENKMLKPEYVPNMIKKRGRPKKRV